MSWVDTAMSQANDLLASDATPWKPQPGEQLIGILKARTTRESLIDGAVYPVLTVAQGEDGPWLDVHAYHHVLFEEITAQDPQPGDVVGIRYIGFAEGVGKGSKGYERYKLVTIHAGLPDPSPGAASPPDARPSEGDGGGGAPRHATAADTSTTPAQTSAPIVSGAEGSDPEVVTTRTSGEGATTPTGSESTTVAAGELADPDSIVSGATSVDPPAATTVATGVQPRGAETSDAGAGERLVNGEPTPAPAAAALADDGQWIVLMSLCGHNETKAVNRINRANRTSFNYATARANATHEHLDRALQGD